MYVFVKDPLSNRYVKEQMPDVRPANFFAFSEDKGLVPSIAEIADAHEPTAAAEPAAQRRSPIAVLLQTLLAR